ncbi:TetR/AcrR family transcriptional regulator [Sphingomonas azotifigens]|uniref:TetR/AcrR family transcriptional regulator n=1 Tax=Sphingomonas azotifigens TaxID=330920 RepID=UPI0014300B7E|nr:TetR/AcrR family transcriptional regulator [Sphingomonas azotifigens]
MAFSGLANYDGAMTQDSRAGVECALAPRGPKGGRPTREVAAQLGGHILEVAFRQFTANGVDGTSMEDIAAAAGVSKRTLYARFGSKLALVQAVIALGVDRQRRRIVSSIPAGGVRMRLAAALRKLLDASLQPEVIGLTELIHWFNLNTRDLPAQHRSSGVEHAFEMIEAILLESPRARALPAEALRSVSTLLLDLAVTIPRERILRRYDMENTPAAKAAFIEQTLALLGAGMPYLDD